MTRLDINPDMHQEAQRLADMVKAILAGHHPAVQGTVLADLTALWLAGHPASIRHETFEMHMATVRQLYPSAAKEFWTVPDAAIAEPEIEH